MKRVSESTYLKMRALAFAIDKCLMDARDERDKNFENAMILSEMNVELFKKEDEHSELL